MFKLIEKLGHGVLNVIFIFLIKIILELSLKGQIVMQSS